MERKSESKKHMRLELDEELHRELKLYAVRNQTTMMKVVIESLRKFLKEQKNK